MVSEDFISCAAKRFREEKLKENCEFCISEPIERIGICNTIDQFIYGKKCSMCMKFIERNQSPFNTKEELIKEIGRIE